MTNLIRKGGYLAAVAVLCLCSSAFGNIITMDFLHGTAPPKGYPETSSIFPYVFHLDGSPQLTDLVCDDFLDGTKPNTWTATKNSIPNLNSSNTYFFAKYGMAAYVEAAFLVEELYETPISSTASANLQWAIWAIFDPVLLKTGEETAGALADYKTALGHAGDNPDLYSDVWVYTPVVDVNGVWKVANPRAEQEFFGIPEASTSTLLGAGLVGLVALML